MKVLFDHPSPFLLAHGGFQTQIEQTKAALEEIGIEVEWLRWWDDAQTGDVIHYFGRPLAGYIRFAHQKGMSVVMSELLTGPGSRPQHVRRAQKLLMLASKNLLPRDFTSKMAWDAYKLADSAIALTSWEKQLMVEMFDADPQKVHVVPNGVEEIFFADPQSALPVPQSELRNPQSPPPPQIPQSAIRNPQSNWLVCTATITERKRVLELAEAAVVAQTPTWIIGKPYAESDPYYLRFLECVRRSNGIIRYEGGISDRVQMADIYKNARGFVLLSTMESLSLSALEAAAAGCPLLLSDLPWARCTFGDQASYCRIASATKEGPILKSFYDVAPNLPPPPRPATWKEVALQLKGIYERL